MLQDQISQEYVVAMKARDTVKSSTLSFLRAQIKNVLIEKRVDHLDDVEVLGVIKKQIKQRQESITQYTQGGRQDLADKEAVELKILEAYVPQQMSAEQVQALVILAIAEVGARAPKDMGMVMKAMAVKVAGRADNKLVSELVKKSLGSV